MILQKYFKVIHIANFEFIAELNETFFFLKIFSP